MQALLILLGSLAYYLFPIWAAGGFRAYFSHPPLVALFVGFLIIVVASMFTGSGIRTGEREDRANRWVLIPFSIIGLALAVVPPYTDRIGLWTIDGDATRWLGVALFLIGGALRIWPLYVLGKRFSGLVAIQPNHTLETTGVYRVIRHPSYLGLIVNIVGWSLAFRSATGLILCVLMIPVLVARMNSEEALLSSHFGAEYDAYRAHTSRLIPGLY